jgi:uncharacterized protein (TIGR03067 family)
MRLRLAVALLVLAGPAAFAPAPFPRSQRRERQPEITLDTFQGRWRVKQMQASHGNGQHSNYDWAVTHIRIRDDRWEFSAGDRIGSEMPISIDASKKPAHLNFYRSTDKLHVRGVGLVRRHGSGVQVIYRWGGENDRPTFEPPTEGGWIITLERD